MYLEAPLLPIPQQKNVMWWWVGVEPSSLIGLQGGTSSTRLRHHSLWAEAQPVSTDQGELTVHQWEYTMPKTWRQKKETCHSGDLSFQNPLSNLSSFFLNINTTFWSSPGTDNWLHFTIEKVWGVKGFLEVLEPWAFKLDGGWVCGLGIGCPHLLGRSVANKASRVCEGSGWIVIVPHSWFVVDEWSYRGCLHVITIKPEDST